MKVPDYFDAFSGDRLAGPPDGDPLRIDDGGAPAYLVGPALFDPQVNGFAGVDFQDPELDRDALEWAATRIRAAGCGGFLLTLITHHKDFLEAQLARVSSWIESSRLLQDTLLGFHLEGPFLSPVEGFTGAHPREHLRLPDWGVFDRLQRAANGKIRMMTLSPELPGSVPFIQRASAEGLWVALGHTDASLPELIAAARAGARLFTHLGNACPGEVHRHDNIIQRVMAVPELTATLIPDGRHLPPMVLSNLVKALGPARVAMTTDSMSAAGAPPGTYRLGDLTMHVGDDEVVRHPKTGFFAGSSLQMVDGLLNLLRFGGVDAAGAWAAWTTLRHRMFPQHFPPLLLLPMVLRSPRSRESWGPRPVELGE